MGFINQLITGGHHLVGMSSYSKNPSGTRPSSLSHGQLFLQRPSACRVSRGVVRGKMWRKICVLIHLEAAVHVLELLCYLEADS